MHYQVPQKFAKQRNSSNDNTKISTLPNRFENLRPQNKGIDNAPFISNPVLVPNESMRIQNQNNKRNTFASHKSRIQFIYTTKKFTQLCPSTKNGSWNCIICNCNEI